MTKMNILNMRVQLNMQKLITKMDQKTMVSKVYAQHVLKIVLLVKKVGL